MVPSRMLNTRTLKAAWLSLLVGVMLLGAALPATSTAQGQEIVVTALVDESAREIVDAWIAAYGAQQPGAVFDVTYAPAAELLDRLGENVLLITGEMPGDLPVAYECGAIGVVHMLLPDLAGRYLSSEDCGSDLSAPAAAARDFLKWVTGPDGQQVAIELGLLPSEVTVTDQAGVTVTVPQPVRRVVSAYGVAPFYVYVVGAGDRLVAANYIGIRDEQSVAAMTRLDPRFDEISQRISSMSQGESNLEEIAAVEPDLLLTSARTAWLDAAGELGVPILRFEGETPERLKEAVALVGAVFGPDAAYRAAQFNAFYDEVLGSIRAQMDGIENPTRVLFTGTEPLRVASGGMYQTAMIEAAGGVSVSKDAPGNGWQNVNLEQIYTWNPAVIFVPTYGGASVEAFTEDPQWAPIQAVASGNVIQLPRLTGPLDIPAPDSIIGIIWMANKLYPGQLDLDCEALTTEFYNRFYEYAITAEEASTLCS